MNGEYMILFPDLLAEIKNSQKKTDPFLWLLNLLHWIVRERTGEEKSAKIETLYTVRLKFVLSQIENDPQASKKISEAIEIVLTKLMTSDQIGYVGIPTATSFQQEFFNRLEEKFLPAKPYSQSFESLISQAFENENESVFIDQIDADIMRKLITHLNFSLEFKNELKRRSWLAAHRLSLDVLHLSNSFRLFMNNQSDPGYEAPEFQIESEIRRLSQTLESARQNQLDHVLGLIRSVEARLESLTSGFLQSGVQIEVVYAKQNLLKRMARLRLVLNFLVEETTKYEAIRNYLAQITLDIHSQHSMLVFLRENLSLLTQRIVQTNANTGEHYVTYSWKEFGRMFVSSLGGGLITSATVFLKYLIGQFFQAGFIKGALESLNYASSFLAIQLMGFTLATKQPSATALYLARALKKSISESRRTMVALLRTQFIAVLGNVLAVSPICFIVGFLAFYFDYSLYTADQSIDVIESSHIFGASPAFAILTGCFLFLSSVIAGWFENFSLNKNLHLRIRESLFLNTYFGSKFAVRISNLFEFKSGAIVANVSLGILLGVIPQFVKFLGIPVEVRHITLAAGSFFSALSQAIHAGISLSTVSLSFFGLFVIGLLNIATSFFLAYVFASISIQAPLRSLLRTLGWGLRLVLTKPWLLIIPESGSSKDKIV